jgi:hypothetical protein
VVIKRKLITVDEFEAFIALPDFNLAVRDICAL